MNKINFFLKDPEAESTTILLLYTCHDGRLKYYTGEKCNPKNFPAKLDNGTSAQLDRITKTVRELVVDYKIKGEPLKKAILKEALDKALHKKQAGKASNLFTAMEKAIDEMEAGDRLTPTQKIYSAGSIKAFKFTKELLKAFDTNMSIKSISLDTYKRFIKWCQKKSYSTNYIGSQIKNWKTLGKAVGGNSIFDDPEFKKITEDATDIYLSEAELKLIYEHKIEDRKMDHVRDWFILDCYTGLRVCDLVLLDKQNYSKGYITIANEKTDDKVVIPAHPYVKKIRIKHSGFPPKVTSHEINTLIKSIARSAGIDGKVLHTITKGGKRVDTYLEKYQMVSNHTARRSFITNLRKNGVPDSIVMKLAGIRSAATLQKYDKLNADEAGRLAAGMKFFK